MPMVPSHGFMPPQQPLPQPQYFSTAPAPAPTYGPPQPTPTVIPPYVPPDLDFGDWSSPLGPSAFPHIPGPAPSHQAPPGMPAPAIGDVFGHIDPSLQVTHTHTTHLRHAHAPCYALTLWVGLTVPAHPHGQPGPGTRFTHASHRR
jgi:hypothetical protein